MIPRLDNPSALFPAGFKAMVALEQALAKVIEPELLELVKLRASQINSGTERSPHSTSCDTRTNSGTSRRCLRMAQPNKPR